MQLRTNAHAAPVVSALLFAMTTWAGVREAQPMNASEAESGGMCSEEQEVSEPHGGADATVVTTDGAMEDNARRWQVSQEHFHGPLDRSVMNAAQALLDLPLGSEVVLGIRGMLYGFRLEPHYHPPGYQGGPTGWHKGVTLYQVMARAGDSLR